MRPLDPQLLKEFIRRAADRVEGDWVVIGGTVLPLLGVGDRATLDIDLIPVGEASQSDILDLMEIAEQMGLPVEAVNQAGAYFLKKIPDFKDHLILLHEGSRAQIFRPDPTLYIRTKVYRLSESDLEDCLAFLRFAGVSGEELDETELREEIRAELEKPVGLGRRERLESLLSAI